MLERQFYKYFQTVSVYGRELDLPITMLEAGTTLQAFRRLQASPDDATAARCDVIRIPPFNAIRASSACSKAKLTWVARLSAKDEDRSLAAGRRDTGRENRIASCKHDQSNLYRAKEHRREPSIMNTPRHADIHVEHRLFRLQYSSPVDRS